MPEDTRSGIQYYGCEINSYYGDMQNLSWRVWAEGPDGRKRSDFVSIQIPRIGSEDVVDYSSAEMASYENALNAENRRLLESARDRLAREGTSWDDEITYTPTESPGAPEWKGAHSVGRCGCGIIHPPHIQWEPGRAPVCWCGEKHEGTPVQCAPEREAERWHCKSFCWCRAEIHNEHLGGYNGRCWCGEYHPLR